MSYSTNHLKRLLEDTTVTVEKYHPKKISDVNNELSRVFEERVLHVMLYGAYNAGKSTLINVILGSAEATVNDIPTTFRVDSYPWNGICLLDTPGVNAPIEHEEATREQVQRSGLMLFVIREGDQDTKDLYLRLFEMLKLKKKVFIVLNHQAASEEDKQTAYQKIVSILTDLGPQYGIDDEVIGSIPVYPVNLNTALRGRIKDSEKLLEHSGYPDFMSGFNQWVTSYNHERQIEANLQNTVYNLWFTPAYQAIEVLIDKNSNAELNQLQDARSILEKEKRLLSHSAFSFIQQEINLARSDIRGVLENSQNPSMCESGLQSIVTAVTGKVESWLQNEISDSSGRISAIISDLPSDLQSSSISNPLKDLVLDEAKKELGNKDNILHILKLGRKLKIPVLKGRWLTTLGKWAGKAAVAVQIISAMYDVYKAGSREDEENRAQRQQAISLNQYVEQVCSDVLQQIHGTVDEIISITFANRIAEVQQEIDKLTGHKDELHKDMEILSKAMSLLSSGQTK